jgi:DNA mismatch repair protein MutS2
MKVEEALEALERFIDQTLLGRMEEFRIIHGHGTGALKRAVRQWLSHCDSVEGFRPGARYEGGDGATIVKVADRNGPSVI